MLKSKLPCSVRESLKPLSVRIPPRSAPWHVHRTSFSKSSSAPRHLAASTGRNSRCLLPVQAVKGTPTRVSSTPNIRIFGWVTVQPIRSHNPLIKCQADCATPAYKCVRQHKYQDAPSCDFFFCLPSLRQSTRNFSHLSVMVGMTVPTCSLICKTCTVFSSG